jgi:MFS family permease
MPAQNIRSRGRYDFPLFLAASAILGVSQSIDGSAFNNFLNDSFHITVFQRTLIEIPRELPGFLVVLIAGALMFLGDRRMAVFANLAAGFGMLMLGWFSSSLGIAVCWTFLYSSGQHLFMPLTNSIGMGFSDNSGVGRRLGLLGSAATAVFLVTSLITFFVTRYYGVRYEALFTVGAAAFAVSAILIALMGRQSHAGKTLQGEAEADGDSLPAKHLPPAVKPRRFIFRREYTLFYLLSIVYGARKQIFITFGPWVLIKAFEQDVGTFALMGFFIAGLGMLVKPAVGYLIDKRGERFVLMGDAVALVVVCLGYGFAETIAGGLGLQPVWALMIVCGCYIADQLLVSTSMARATYLRKIAVTDEDVPLTLSMGISMDHVVSMIIPFCGAFLWNAAGYSFVFLGGAVIAAINFTLAARLKTSAS